MEFQVLRSQPWGNASASGGAWRGGAGKPVHSFGPARLWASLMLYLRHRLRVVLIATDGPDRIAVYITGRRLDELAAGAGRSFRWRFLTGNGWRRAHVLLASAAPDRMTMWIIVPGGADDGASPAAGLRPGVRVLAEALRPVDHGTGRGDTR